MSHASIDAAADADRKGRDPSADTTCADSQRWATSPRRLDAHRLVARTMGLAASATSSQPLVAASLGVSLRSFQRLCDPNDKKRIALADIGAARPDFARSVLVAILASIPEDARVAQRSPEAHAMRLTSAVGDVAERIEEALEDGNLSQEERRTLARSLQKLIERAQCALHDLGDA